MCPCGSKRNQSVANRIEAINLNGRGEIIQMLQELCALRIAVGEKRLIGGRIKYYVILESGSLMYEHYLLVLAQCEQDFRRQDWFQRPVLRHQSYRHGQITVRTFIIGRIGRKTVISNLLYHRSKYVCVQNMSVNNRNGCADRQAHRRTARKLHLVERRATGFDERTA